MIDAARARLAVGLTKRVRITLKQPPCSLFWYTSFLSPPSTSGGNLFTCQLAGRGAIAYMAAIHRHRYGAARVVCAGQRAA